MCSWLPGSVGKWCLWSILGKGKVRLESSSQRFGGGGRLPLSLSRVRFPRVFPGCLCFLLFRCRQPHPPQAHSYGQLSSVASGCSPWSLNNAHGLPHHALLLLRQPTLVSLLPLRLSLPRLATLPPLLSAPSVSFLQGPVLGPLPIPHLCLRVYPVPPTLKSHRDTDNLQASPAQALLGSRPLANCPFLEVSTWTRHGCLRSPNGRTPYPPPPSEWRHITQMPK